jgi:hypothetical protein
MKHFKMRSVNYTAAVTLTLLFVISCGKIEKLPPEPSIEFKSFEIFDSTDILGNIVKGGRLHFSFVDGDGDLGLKSPELGTSVDSTNLFFILYRKTGGKFGEASGNDPLKPSPYRIPYMDRQGQNKILRGDISITFLYMFYTPADTIKYRFYVKDRADHPSDTATTCEIVITNNKICTK